MNGFICESYPSLIFEFHWYEISIPTYAAVIFSFVEAGNNLLGFIPLELRDVSSSFA